MNMQPTAPWIASYSTTAIEPACLQILDFQSCSNWREQCTSCTLDTGGCVIDGKGWIVFHRDIKSADIRLAADFTGRLIGCGLAKFVPDDNSNIIPGLGTQSVAITNGGHTFGTSGYMCPEYVGKNGLPCPCIAAFYMYSIGIVMVELILGCLIGGQSTRNGKQFKDVFAMFVKDARHRVIGDGWGRLKNEADPVIFWKPESLDLVCKTAIRCMAPFPEDRLSTHNLLPCAKRGSPITHWYTKICAARCCRGYTSTLYYLQPPSNRYTVQHGSRTVFKLY